MPYGIKAVCLETREGRDHCACAVSVVFHSELLCYLAELFTNSHVPDSGNLVIIYRPVVVIWKL